jgi:penicillin-binding protein 2
VGIGQGAVATTPVQLMRAISAISMDGRMVVPHVASPTGLPPEYLETHHYTDVTNIPINPDGFNLITDAMARVLLPEGTAPSAHVPGVDIAGKTGSAQIVSLAVRALHQNNEALNQNGWFVGFTPRRNPDIIVAVLFEGGEHGKLAARLATQVIKAYVDKQRRQPTKVASGSGQVDVGAVWNSDSGADDDLHGGHFDLEVPKSLAPLAVAAPGLQ